jgi:hypothetical protein
MMKTVTVRGIDVELDRSIKARAASEDLSANQWIVQALKKATGTGKKQIFPVHHDLDELAGGWTREETKAFAKNTKAFEKIDEELWK